MVINLQADGISYIVCFFLSEQILPDDIVFLSIAHIFLERYTVLVRANV